MTGTTGTPEPLTGTAPPAGDATSQQVNLEAHPSNEPAAPSATPAAAPSGDSPPGSGRNRELAIERDAAIEYGQFWRQRYQESQQQATAPQPQEDPRPKRADFDDDEAWADALTGWTEKRAERRAEEAAESRFTRAREEERLRTMQGTFQSRAQTFAQTTPDYQTAIGNPALTFFNGQFLEAAMDSEKGPEVLYHIAKSPELVAKLARQSVPQRIATLGRLEAELSRPAPPPRRSEAPPPLSPVGSGPGTAQDIFSLPPKEFLRARLEQRAARQK